MILSLSLFVFILFIFIVKREKNIEQKFEAFELSLEKLHKEVFLLKKNKDSDIEEKFEQLENIINSLLEKIKIIEEINNKEIEKLKEEVNKIRNDIKKNRFFNINTNISKNDENKILEMHKEGYSIEEISKILRIPAGEVEFILKFSSF